MHDHLCTYIHVLYQLYTADIFSYRFSLNERVKERERERQGTRDRILLRARQSVP